VSLARTNTILEKSGGFTIVVPISTCWGYAGLLKCGQSEEASATIYNLSADATANALRRMLRRN